MFLRPFSFLLAAPLALASVIAAPGPVAIRESIAATSSNQEGTSCACRKPIIRKEWRTLPFNDQIAYIKAVKCLIASPSKSHTAAGARTRFDDFIGVHLIQAPFIHFVGHFHAWHRDFVSIYEKTLREECHYRGAQPYWDWSLDAVGPNYTHFFSSPVFNPIYGLGGNGNPDNSSIQTASVPISPGTGGGCIASGPFKNLTVNIGPLNNTHYNPHCTRRSFSVEQVPPLAPSNIISALSVDTFLDLMVRAEGNFTNPNITIEGYHGAGHFAVGGLRGSMSDVAASPSDPIFFLHHANVDRIWAEWQKRDPARRYLEVGGTDVPFAYPFTPNRTGTPVTLRYPLNLAGDAPYHALAKPIVVRDVMRLRTSLLCYDYE
ncbi:hypothetical protein HKX48_001305 [Thoreauomyces humboldtii]|nr:hypothetical protein HKX48_001305 [Thoreauomyces humboldtii]